MNRGAKYLTFDLFWKSALGEFSRIAVLDERHAFFGQIYQLSICPGGRNGGTDKRLVEIFYGNRPYDRVVEAGETIFSIRKRLLTEAGASLTYLRRDDGSVICTLTPARAEIPHRREQLVELRHYPDARALTGESALTRDWKLFMSYQAVTSLDGNARWSDQIRIWWMLFVKPLVVGNARQQRAILTWAGKVATWVLTVGLSGALLFIVQNLSHSGGTQ